MEKIIHGGKHTIKIIIHCVLKYGYLQVDYCANLAATNALEDLAIKRHSSEAPIRLTDFSVGEKGKKWLMSDMKEKHSI